VACREPARAEALELEEPSSSDELAALHRLDDRRPVLVACIVQWAPRAARDVERGAPCPGPCGAEHVRRGECRPERAPSLRCGRRSEAIGIDGPASEEHDALARSPRGDDRLAGREEARAGRPRPFVHDHDRRLGGARAGDRLKGVCVEHETPVGGGAVGPHRDPPRRHATPSQRRSGDGGERRSDRADADDERLGGVHELARAGIGLWMERVIGEALGRPDGEAPRRTDVGQRLGADRQIRGRPQSGGGQSIGGLGDARLERIRGVCERGLELARHDEGLGRGPPSPLGRAYSADLVDGSLERTEERPTVRELLAVAVNPGIERRHGPSRRACDGPGLETRGLGANTARRRIVGAPLTQRASRHSARFASLWTGVRQRSRTEIWVNIEFSRPISPRFRSARTHQACRNRTAYVSVHTFTPSFDAWRAFMTRRDA